MFMFTSRSAARNFKNGRDGYLVKDLSVMGKVEVNNGKTYRWGVTLPNPSVKLFG